jgi:ribonuclease HI
VASAAQAEAYACEEAVRSAADWGMVDVSIETDAQNLVRALHGTEFDRTLEGVIYRISASTCNYILTRLSVSMYHVLVIK